MTEDGSGQGALLERRARLAADGQVTTGGRFEVLAITAGEGNGWKFSEACLRESLALWDGAECFVDHAWQGHSVRDLAGVLTAPAWDAGRRGIRCRLKAVGPSAPLLIELGSQLLAEDGQGAGGGEKTPRVGFSADVVFTSQGKEVRKILRVLSVDLVINPARGGAFLRALNSRMPQGVNGMDGENINAVEQMAGAPESSTALQQQLSADAGAARQARAQMCGYLLDSGLSAARLPAPVAERIRKNFAGKLFEPAELTQAIADARSMLSELGGAGVIQGPGRISGMWSSEDQFSAAVYDLLGADRPDELKAAKTAKLSGIRELYTLMTGDREFVGGYNPEHAQFAVVADLPGVLKNALNKLIVSEWQELGRSGYRWWEPVVTVEHFTSLHDITGVLVGEVTVLPVVAEAAAYTSLAVKDSPETASFVKYGGYIGLTLEMFERDETWKLRQFARKLASSGLRRISALVAAVFTSDSGTGPAMADTYHVFDAANHANLGTAALASASWETASSAIYNQLLPVGAGGTAPKQAVDAKYCLVPRALRLAAMNLLYPSLEHTANLHSENMQKGEMGDVITCPEFSDANDWAAVADPRIAPAIIVGERFGLLPEIIIADATHQGALFSNDEIRMKARHWLAVCVADYRPLYKANVA